MQINFFTIVNKIFYPIVFVYIFILDGTYNYVYAHGYEDKGMYFTVPTDYCSFYVGPQARNSVYKDSTSDTSRHSFYIENSDEKNDYQHVVAITPEWHWGQFKPEFAHAAFSGWHAISSTANDMKKSQISCTSPSDAAYTHYYGLFNLSNTSSNQKTTTRNMHVTKRTLASNGRIMNLAPLTIGDPRQGGWHDNIYSNSGAHVTIPQFTVEPGIAMLGHSRADLAIDPEVYDSNFTQLQHELRGVGKKQIYFSKYNALLVSLIDKYKCNTEDVGGRFKVYAGFLFFHRVQSTINNHGKIQGYYGIAASCPIPYHGDINRLKDSTGFHGTINNKSLGIIAGEKAAIDIDAGASTYTAIGDITINNEESARIEGSIIIPDIQKGVINNKASITPNSISTKACTMELKLGGIGQLNNLHESIINTYNLFIGKTNKNAVINNYGMLNVTNILEAPKLINYNSGQLLIKEFSDAVKLYENYGVISVSKETSITYKNNIKSYKDSMITTNNTLTIDNRNNGNFNNKGSITVISNALYLFNFTNMGEISANRILGNYFINNGDVVSLLLNLEISTTNNNNFYVRDLTISNRFKNTKFIKSDNLIVATITLNNEGTIAIKNSIITKNNSKIFNDVNARLIYFGNNCYFNASKTSIINKGAFIVKNNLKLQSNLTTSATFAIGKLFSINNNKLIKTADSYCYIENFADGIIENLGGIKIKNVVGKAYIDNYSPIIKTQVSTKGEFNIDYLSLKEGESYIVNNGSIIINHQAELNNTTIANYGTVTSLGNTNFLGKFTYTNRGNFIFGTGVTLEDPDFIFAHTKANKKVIFPNSINTKLNIHNQAILQLDQPISLTSYKGSFDDNIIINASTKTSSSTAYLSADTISLFSDGVKPQTRIILNINQIDLKKKQTITLLQAKNIFGLHDVNGEMKSFLYGDMNYLSHLNDYSNKDSYEGKKLVLVASQPRIIKTQNNNEQLIVDYQWMYTPKYFYKPDNKGIYSMDYINRLTYGYITPGVNFNIFCDGPTKQWYTDKNIIYIGKASSNLPITNIKLSTNNIEDAFSITSLYTITSIGHIKVLSTIEANNITLQANALAIRTKKAINESYSHKKLPTDEIYLLDKLHISKNARLTGGQRNKSGLELACLLTGSIENYGFITGYNGINIIGPLNYINGNINNYGNIIATIVINTHMNIPYASDKSRKCIITNYKKMHGSFILGGYNCDFINEGSVVSKDKGIIGHYSNNNTIKNNGDMKVSCINIEESSSTLNLINNGILSIDKFSVLNNLTNYKYLITKQDLGIINLLSNHGVLIAPKINTSDTIQLRYNAITPNAAIINSGTIIINSSFKSVAKLTNKNHGVIKIKESLLLLSDDFTNYGMIYADNSIQIESSNVINEGLISTNILSIANDLDLGKTGSIYTKQIKSISSMAAIKGSGDLFINNKVITFDNNLDINTNKLTINTEKININNTININTNKLIINNGSNTCDININPGSKLTLKYSHQTSKNINLINSGTLELKSVLFSALTTPLHEITTYTANRGSNLTLRLPDLLSKNNEITDLAMPLIKIDKIAKLDKKTTKINILPTGTILRDSENKITILQAAALFDENNNKLINVDNIINKSFTTDNIELTLNDIKIENNSITAIVNLIDKRRLGPNMRRAEMLVSANLLGKSYYDKDKELFGIAYTYNHQVNNLNTPVNSASLTSAYTDNLILSPISVIDYGLNFNAQILNIKPTKIKEINSVLGMPALIIGTTVLPDKFFSTSLNNYITFDSIKLSNIVINGKNDYARKAVSVDGLVINGSNDLRLQDGIYFDATTKLLAGASNHALNFACYYVGDIINNGIIGDGVNYSAVHLNQPIEGTLTNNNKITASVNAIDITTMKSWPQGKSFTIINNGSITGSIEVTCKPNIGANPIKVVNNGNIIANKIESSCNNININNTANGKLKITGLIKVSANNFINDGLLEANNLLLESNLTSNGNITANYLQGNNYKLTAPYIEAKNIENTSLKANLVKVSSSIFKKVIIDAILAIGGKVENQGELTIKTLEFEDKCNLTNKGSINITSPSISLDNSIFNNQGNLTVNDTLNLTGDFNTSRGKLLVNTLKLTANNINASEGAIIKCNHLINTASNSSIVMQKGTVFELGNNIATNTTTTISGSITFSTVALSDYTQNKHEASLKLNANLTYNNGMLQAGNLITDNKNPIYLTITKKAQMLFDLPIQEAKLHIVNRGIIALADDNHLYSYQGENATIEMSLKGQNTDTANSLLTTTDKITFDNNSIIRLKPSIDALPTPYNYTKLFTSPLNNIIYENSSGATNVITTDNIVSLIDKQENNKRILRLKDIKVTHTATNSIVSAIIGIRNIANFPSYMAYLDQQLHSNLLVEPCCDTTNTIEGIAWAINYQNNTMQSNNLIISPYNLVDTYRIANFNVINKELYLVSPQDKPTYIGVINNYPAVVIGTEITSTDATQKIITNNNSILAINSIFLDNIIIDGSKKINDSSRNTDGLLITGNNALHINKFLEIGTKCILKSRDNNHPLHIAAKFNGNINNFGSIGNIDPHVKNAILISQPYSGTITNYNIIQAINTALTINSEANWSINNKLNLVNKGEITGGIIINKSANAKQDITMNLINYGDINNYHGDDDNPCKIKHDNNTILNIYNKYNAQIIMSTLAATEITNRGYIITSQLKFNQLKNYGYFILLGTDTFKINNNNFINQGLLQLTKEINLTGNFTNNGTIETTNNIDTKNYNLTNKGIINSKASIKTNYFINATNSIVNVATLNIGLATGKLTNYGNIVIDSLIQQGTLVNNNYLQINSSVKLIPKIINNGTLEVTPSIKLTDDYNNNGYIKTNILDGEYLTIINTNPRAKIETSKLQNITIKGSVIITKEITGTVNITNLYSNNDIYNYSNLTVDSWVNETGKVINYGSVKINDFKINNLLNYGLLTAKILDATYAADENMQVDNYGSLHANALSECNLNNYNKGYAVFNTIGNSDIINQGTLKVSNSLVNNVIIEGSLQIVTEVQQHGHCQVEFITGDYLKIYGTINAAAVNINYLYNEATLKVSKQLTIDVNNKLDNYGDITTAFIDISGVLFNRNLANLTITKQDSIRLANTNCINYGNITTKNNILIYDKFNSFGSITAATIKVAENAQLINTGNLHLCYINNNLLSNKIFKNKANLTVANDAILREQFINDGIISANKISSVNQNINFINNRLAKFNIIENIQVVNNGVFSVENSILGDVSITGVIKLGSEVNQNGSLFVDNIQAASDITSVNFNIQDNSFCSVSKPLIDKSFNIVNNGCLYLKPKSKINSYVSYGGILKIYLPQDLSTIKEPLLSATNSIELYDNLNEKPLIVLLANQFTNIRKNQNKQQITILEAKNILLNKDNIQQSMLADILAVQDASAIDDSLVSNSILLHISSSRIETTSKTSIYANVYWEEIKNIKGLLSRPLSLTKLATVLQQEQAILYKKKIFSDIKSYIENNSIPKETSAIVNSLSKTMNVKQLLFLPFPENSACNQELIINNINEAISSLNKRLTTDRISESYNNKHGINAGSLYQNLYVWSSFSFQKENNYKQSLYPYGDNTSKILNFGIDTQFNRKLKLGFMLANISTIAKTLGKTLNAEYNVTRNYEVKGMLSTVYFSQMFNLCTLNVYLNTAKYKFNQNMNCAFSGKTAYNASLLGIHGEVIYPLSYNNFILEFAELIRINSISLATYNFENKLIHYGYRRNIINIGVSASCYYNIPLTLDSKLYLGCALTYMYNFAPNQQQKFAVSYFDNDFNITQQIINQHDIKVDSLVNLTLFNKLKLAVNAGIGFKASSKYLNGKLKLNYSF